MSNKDINLKASKAGIGYTIGNLLLKGCVFFSLPIFTRLLRTEDFGIYNTYMAYEGIVSAIIGMGIYGTVKNAKIDFKDMYDNYISSVFALILVVFAGIVLILNIFYPLYGNIIGFSRFVINCLLFQSMGACAIHFYGIKLNTEFNYKSFLGISIINSIGSIILSILLILFVFPNERYLGRIFGSAMPPILIVCGVGIHVLRKGRTLFHKKYWKYALFIGLPLVPHVVSQSLLAQFDRIMISNMVGMEEAGIYSYMYTICTITYIIALSLDSAWTPWLFYKLNGGNEKEVLKISKKYIDLFCILTIGFMCVIPELAKFLASEDYWTGLDLIIPLAVTNFCVFLYLLPVSIEYYHKKTGFISIGTVGAAILNIILNYIGINVWGYRAAAYTTLISYFALFIFHSIVASRFGFNSIFNIKYLLARFAIITFVAVSMLVLSTYNIIYLLYRLLLVAIIIYVAYRNKEMLFSILGRKGKA